MRLLLTPDKTYIDIREDSNSGNRYRPVSYEEEADDTVTVTCQKANKEFPLLGGYNVFGINPDNLKEIKE